MSDKKGASGGLNDQLILTLLILGVPTYFLYKSVLAVKALYHAHTSKFHYGFWALGSFALLSLLLYLWNLIADFHGKKADEQRTPPKIKVGVDFKTKEKIEIEEKARLYHTQVIGSTGSGKTEGIIIPWIFDDIEKGRGLIIIDGKPEVKNLQRLYGKILKAGRIKDFKLFSIASPERSNTFNPFSYGSSEQITEKIFSSFQTENEHYKAVQYSATASVIRLIQELKAVPKPGLIRELLNDKAILQTWVDQTKDKTLHSDFKKILNLPEAQFQKDFAGILSYLEVFSKGDIAPIINQDHSEINFEDALLKNQIIYFQLPTLGYPTLASNIGRLAIQSIAQAAGELQSKCVNEPEQLFSLYLDDFNDYMYEGFGSVVNKVRSAGVGIVFAHQSLGDLSKVSPEFESVIIENTNNKILLKINDPESADFFSMYIGTKSTEKVTERRTKKLIGAQNTGEQSVRETEEFIIHPNTFKSEFGPGDAVAIIQRLNGSRAIQRIKCTPNEEYILPLSPPNRKHKEVTFVSESQKYHQKKTSFTPEANA